LPGLQAANAGDGELWEFSQQQQFPPALIICGPAMLQVFAINSGQPCKELLIVSKAKMNIFENNLYIVISSTYFAFVVEFAKIKPKRLKTN
jgi:hypothetical protein